MYNGKFKGPHEDDDENDPEYKPTRWYHILIVIGIIIGLGILARHIIII